MLNEIDYFSKEECEPFKVGTCKKCGHLYGYIGLDIGLCVYCLDKLETCG